MRISVVRPLCFLNGFRLSILFYLVFPGGPAVYIGNRQTDEGRFGGHIFLQKQADAHFGNIRHGLHNGGADILCSRENPDAVKTDHLYVLWDAQI